MIYNTTYYGSSAEITGGDKTKGICISVKREKMKNFLFIADFFKINNEREDLMKANLHASINPHHVWYQHPLPCDLFLLGSS